MLLRNYDNIMTLKALGSTDTTKYLDTSGFGDGILSLKMVSGTMCSVLNTYAPAPFNLFDTSYSNAIDYFNSRSSNLICGSLGGGEDVTYDDYTLNVITNFKYVSSSISGVVYDSTDNSYSVTFKKTYFNNTGAVQTVGYIGVSYRPSGDAYHFLVYKEKLETPVEVPVNASITLTFTQKVYANPNKPTDYVATASVEG